MKKALIIVDVQLDFLPGGSLAIKDGDKIIDTINCIKNDFDLIVLTQDWHPKDHCSFKQWPVHCVQNTLGAEIHPGILANIRPLTLNIQKGWNKDVDSYSAFYDNDHKTSTGLTQMLRDEGVKQVTVVGLATDFCIKYTALDAVKDGFGTTVVINACKPVDSSIENLTKIAEEFNEANIAQIIY